MAQHRYRQNKIKREHTIIDGILPILETIAAHPHVQGITPGRINKRSSNRNTTVTFQYKTDAGLKLLARSTTAVQEVFVVTDHPDQVLEELAKQRLIKAPDRKPKRGIDAPSAEREKKRVKGESADRAENRAQKRPQQPPDPASHTPDAAQQPEPARPEEPSPSRRPEVADAIDPETQERLKSLARKGTGDAPPVPPKPSTKPTHVWRDLVKTHRELLALDESLRDLD